MQEQEPASSQAQSPQPTPKPRKRVTILSMGSFWWKAIRDALKHSREPFEHITSLLAIVGGAAVWLYILHKIAQEWVDTMIYWTLAIPFVVWVVWLVWNLIKMPYKIYKTDIAALSAGADAVIDRKAWFRNFARFFLTTIIVGAFMGVLFIKNKQISDLQSKLTRSKQEESPKPYAVKEIIKTNNQPVIANQETATNSAIVISNTEPQKFTDVYKPRGEGPTNYLDAVAESVQKRNEEKRASEKLAEENAEREKLLALNVLWTNFLPHCEHTLTSLHGAVYNIASSQRTNISETYFIPTRFPSEIKSGSGTINIAEIALQNNTNWNFDISLQSKADTYRSTFFLRISCPGGSLNLQMSKTGNAARYQRHFSFLAEKYKDLAGEMSDPSLQPITKIDEAIDSGIEALISANNQFLTEASTNRGDTNIADKK